VFSGNGLVPLLNKWTHATFNRKDWTSKF